MVAMMPVGASRREIMPADSRRRVTVATAAAAEDMPGAKAAAAMDGAAPEAATATVKNSGAAPEAATASTTTVKNSAAAFKTAATSTAMTSVATMAAFDFDRRGIGDVLRCRRSAGIDQRKRLSVLAWQGQRQYRGSRKAPATDKAAPGIWNPDHL
jgi:hypothetical protein